MHKIVVKGKISSYNKAELKNVQKKLYRNFPKLFLSVILLLEKNIWEMV